MISRSDARWMADVRQAGVPLERLSDRALRGETDRVRESVFRETGSHEERVLQTMALANESARRVLGWTLYDVQLLAARALTGQNIAEMQTGEGKTIAALPAAVWGGVLGRGAHIATPNAYLAKRDYQQLKPCFELLGLSVGLIGPEGEMDQPPRDAYASDVTYGAGYEFGFDYLKDQRAIKQQHFKPRGKRFLEKLRGEAEGERRQRGLGMILVDEADNVLIDDAMSPQVLSEFQTGAATDADAVMLARIVASTLESPQHYRESADRQIHLTDEGNAAIHATGLDLPVEQLQRPWADYVETAIRASAHFHCDVQYVIRDEKVKIVDQSTGRIFEDRSWQAGLHQAIEAKESLPITAESLPLARITRQRFFRLYRHLAGMTGTVGDCGKEFKAVYQLGATMIPLRVPSRRKTLPSRLFECEMSKWEAITESVIALHQCQQPVLIGTRTVRDSRLLASLLDQHGLAYALLNGVQDADEAAVVSAAGQRGAITIATNLAGRGTDIKLESGVAMLGGLHVIVAECHESQRADRQLVGRSGRQGDPGSCQTFVSLDDWLIQHHAPWVAQAIRGASVPRGNSAGELNYPIEKQIRSIQRRLERERFGIRLQLLQADKQRNDRMQGILKKF